MKNIIKLFPLIIILSSCAYIEPAGGRKPTAKTDIFAPSTVDTTTVRANPITENKNKNKKLLTETNIVPKQTPKPAPVASFSNGNISSLELSSKANGTMIKIETNELFQEKDVAVSINQDNFINITIYKGRLDKSFPENLRSVGNISDISYFSFPESTQLTIKLQKKVASKSVIIKPDKIIISLFESE